MRLRSCLIIRFEQACLYITTMYIMPARQGMFIYTVCKARAG